MDCISRRQAIEAVGYYSLHIGDKLFFADRPLKELPSVQPDVPTNAPTNTPTADTISRQGAKDELCKMLHECFGADDEELDAVMVTVDNLPTVRPEQQWIPCSERLPERGIDVLVTRDYDGRADFNKSCRYVEVASRYGEDDDVVWNSYSDEYKMSPKNHKVIAWMALPEPYQAERREE